MTQNRTDLNFEKNNSTYIILTVILVILSSLGVYLFLQIQQKPQVAMVEETLPTEISSPTPKLIETEEPTSAPSSTIKPTLKPSNTPTDSAPTVLPTPTPEYSNFSADDFAVTYHSSRKLYQDKEFSGNRYTFYSQQGNIAIHTGTQWSWTYPNRLFTPDLKVSEHLTFVYELDTQKIVDFENGDQKYTIQCIHNGIADLKSECDKLISSFKLN